MTTISTSMSVLSFKNNVVVNVSGIDSLHLYDNLKNTGETYGLERNDFTNSRQIRHKHNQKLKDNFKELEQLFLHYRCIHLQWGIGEPLFLVFNSGSIASLQLDNEQSLIEKITIDTTLCGKLASDHIADVVFSDVCSLISYTEPKLTYIHYNKQIGSISSKLRNNRKGKIVGHGPQVNTIDLPGLSSKRMEKKLSINNLKDCVLVWWRFTSGDVWPWMPLNHNIDRINFFVYVLNGYSIDLLCSTKVHGELQHARFSRWHSNRILTIEESNDGGQYNVNICTYEISHGRCQCTSLLKMPLNSHITAFDWTISEDKLLLSDEEMALLMYDLRSNTTLITNTQFVVKEIVWHPNSVIACFLGVNGNLQFFDAALTLLNLQVSSESVIPNNVMNLLSILHPHKIAQKVLWKNYNQNQNISQAVVSNDISDSLLVYFETGILAFVNFSFGCITKRLLTPLELISQYLKADSVNESVCILQCLNWCSQSELCFQCLSKITNFLLRKPLNLQIESAIQLCLGTFYDNIATFPKTVLNDYHQQIDHLARRFFNHLLRYHRFEKAYLLAVNLQSRDLFLDLHHVAKKEGETMLAIVSFKHAEQLEISDGSLSNQSDSSCEDEQEYCSISSCDSTSAGSIKGSHFLSLINRTGMHRKLHNVHHSQLTHIDDKKHNTTSSYLEQISTQYKSESNFRNIATDDSYFKSLINFDSSDQSTQLFENKFLDKHIMNLPIETKYNEQYSELSSNPFLGPAKQNKLYLSTLKGNKKNYKEQSSKQVIESEKVEDEDEDLEGTRVKFVHFGIV